jgi:hypothetical protein
VGGHPAGRRGRLHAGAELGDQLPGGAGRQVFEHVELLDDSSEIAGSAARQVNCGVDRDRCADVASVKR